MSYLDDLASIIHLVDSAWASVKIVMVLDIPGIAEHTFRCNRIPAKHALTFRTYGISRHFPLALLEKGPIAVVARGSFRYLNPGEFP